MSGFRTLFLFLAIMFLTAAGISIFCNLTLEQATKRGVTYFYVELDENDVVEVLNVSATIQLEAKNTSTMPFALTLGDGTILSSVLEERQLVKAVLTDPIFKLGIGEKALVELSASKPFDVRILSQGQLDMTVPIASLWKIMAGGFFLSSLLYLVAPLFSRARDEKAKRDHSA